MMSFTVIRPLSSSFSFSTSTRSILCSCITSRASSIPVPTGTEISFSRGAIIADTGKSKRVSKRKSRLVTMPTTLPSCTTGSPDILRLRCERSASSSPISLSGDTVTGSFTMPLSWRFTLRTAKACCSGVIFLWIMPMPPSCAIEIARRASVTVSMAADNSGRFNVIFLVSGVLSETSRGRT